MHGYPTGSTPAAAPDGPVADRQLALVDLLDRLLTGGAVVTGDVVLSIADVDLVHINLRAVIRSLGPDAPSPWWNADPADPEK
ncbi:gas vesicle protein [Actinacidiphila oryziradicis]|jgi:hypothetical protein|uniref:Gas vesicle protein n=1 Tax=Actinacidiphila oryziradicis TaxID=2571141 RepID=A0A4U0RWR5_9ACTN|nr:gas vesicle protein [Actinacidiphila oryziradicis]MCW2872723.1 gas vesicle protein [Actinacidiphila oryziradicis]MDX6330365.1 hypothetical protein [Streptomycetaceae bacterium]TKA00756.1 gas vesicle protein [Actinacidiphila oryziradicis]